MTRRQGGLQINLTTRIFGSFKMIKNNKSCGGGPLRLTLVEAEICTQKDGPVKVEMNINHHGPRPISVD